MKVIRENDKTYYALEYNDEKFTSMENLLMYIILLIEFQTEKLNNVVSEYRTNKEDDFSELKTQIRDKMRIINDLIKEYESIFRIIK